MSSGEPKVTELDPPALRGLALDEDVLQESIFNQYAPIKVMFHRESHGWF
jgi:hypothetical protein